jgi:hypothetical protein
MEASLGTQKLLNPIYKHIDSEYNGGRLNDCRHLAIIRLARLWWFASRSSGGIPEILGPPGMDFPEHI